MVSIPAPVSNVGMQQLLLLSMPHTSAPALAPAQCYTRALQQTPSVCGPPTAPTPLETAQSSNSSQRAARLPFLAAALADGAGRLLLEPLVHTALQRAGREGYKFLGVLVLAVLTACAYDASVL